MIHDWCGRLDDLDSGHRCPCHSNRTTAGEVKKRHREAVQRAQQSGWAPPPRVIRPARPLPDPAGRRWAMPAYNAGAAS